MRKHFAIHVLPKQTHSCATDCKPSTIEREKCYNIRGEEEGSRAI